MDDAPHATGYDAAYAQWQRDPHVWWAAAAEGITWDRRWDAVFDPATGPYGRWFPGAKLNTAYNCLDRHIASGHGARTALIWDSAMTGRVERFTYAELTARVAKTAGALAARGVTYGDRVVIYMPMVPEAVIAMLATARLGAIHSVVFGGFRGSGAGSPHRGRATEGDRVGVVRARTGACGEIQTAVGCGDRAVAA